MSKVVIIRCETYDYAVVKKAVQKGISLLGGVEQFVKSGEKILLKPNWIVAEPPEKCATTHPSVFKAVGEVFKAAGAVLSYGDSPGFASPETAAKKTGCAGAATELGMNLADFKQGKDIVYDKATQNRLFHVANGVLDCDGLVSLPKLKTHGFLKLTGAIKNQFGCIPGALKGEFHVKLTNPEHFAKMLVDLNAFIKPRLYIMDGITAMEGNGPMGGDPKQMNVLLFSADPVALDATVCRMIDVDPALSFTIKYGREAGMGVWNEEEVELAGDPIESFKDKKFNVNKAPIASFREGGPVIKFFNNLLVPRPFIAAEKCIKCGVCVKMCPVNPKVLDWHDGVKTNPPSYNYDRCIRCYCCQELCPESAISLKVPFIRRLFSKRA